MIVRTVTGDIDPADLGRCFMHEHLIIDSPLVADRFPHIHLPSVDDAVTEVAAAAAAGVGAMVDAMPCAAGRHPERLVEISHRTGVSIVASTGLHTAKYYPGHRWALAAPAEELVPLFVADIRRGIDRYDYTGPIVRHTAARAGIIKIATGPEGVDARAKEVFAAAAESHRRTGVPILTHCEDGRDGIAQVDLLDGLGVPPERIVLSHTDKVLDLGYHRDLLSTGVSVEYDQALRQDPDADRGTAWLVALMVEEGFDRQVMLGTDGARRSLWSTLGGGPGLAWLSSGFPAVLARNGVDDATVRRLFVTNPARSLAFDPT